MRVGMATDHPTTPNMPSPNHTVSPDWIFPFTRLASLAPTFRVKSSACLRRLSVGVRFSLSLLMSQLHEPAQEVHLQPGGGGAGLLLPLVDLLELRDDNLFQLTQFRSPEGAPR